MYGWQHDAMLTTYYLESGQDLATGIPSRSRLLELDLGWVADHLDAVLPVKEWNGPLEWSLENYPVGKSRV